MVGVNPKEHTTLCTQAGETGVHGCGPVEHSRPADPCINSDFPDRMGNGFFTSRGLYSREVSNVLPLASIRCVNVSTEAGVLT